MSHVHNTCPIHYVFATKYRRKIITADLRPRLWAYMGGVAKKNKIKPLIIGGTDNHIHMVLSLPTTITIAKAAQLVKGGSSKWVSDTFSDIRDFEWQEGYGSFATNISIMEATVAYINNQEVHHRTETFEEEYERFLKRHGIEYDPKELWE